MLRRPGTVLFVALGLSLPMAAGVVLGASVPAAGTTSVQALGLLGPFGQDGSGTGYMESGSSTTPVSPSTPRGKGLF